MKTFENSPDRRPPAQRLQPLGESLPVELATRNLETLVRGRTISHVIEATRLALSPFSVGNTPLAHIEAAETKMEVIALAALTQFNQPRTLTADATDSNLSKLTEALEKAAEAVIWAYLGSEPEVDPAPNSPSPALSDLQEFVRITEIMLRHTSYPYMLEVTLGRLFDNSSLAGQIENSFGFKPLEALEVLKGLQSLQDQKLRSITFPDGDPLTALSRGVLVEAALPPSKTSFSAAEISRQSSVSEEATSAVLRNFTYPMQQGKLQPDYAAYFSGINPLRRRPVILDDEGKYLLIHDAFIVSSIRENLESQMVGGGIWNTYQKRRGKILEKLANEAFTSLLPGSKLFPSLKYYVPANDKEEAGSPDGYTKQTETDLLVILDDVAIIVESKSATMPSSAREGNHQRLSKALKDLLQSASAQADRLRSCVDQDGLLRTERFGSIDFTRIKEIHTVVVTLEDLSITAIAASKLQEAGLLQPGPTAWLVSVHDLQIISKHSEHVSDFLSYLRRRRSDSVRFNHLAIDEIDLYAMHLKGLLTDKLECDVQTPTVRNYQTSVPPNDHAEFTVVGTLSEPFDRWHHHQGPKPVHEERPLEQFVRSCESAGIFSSSSLGATLLNLPPEVQKEVLSIPSPAHLVGKQLSNHHTIILSPSSGNLDCWLLHQWQSVAPPNVVEISAAYDMWEQLSAARGIKRGAVLFYNKSGDLVGVMCDSSDPEGTATRLSQQWGM